MQGILLAAGFGRRFQAEQNTQNDKLLAHLPNQTNPILWHSANALITALPSSIAIVQPHQIQRATLLRRLGFTVVESEAAALGMGHAIADAVQATQSAQGWLITLADMPYVSAALIKKISASVKTSNSIVAPVFEGKRGHPVAFGPTWFSHLSTLKGDAGARTLLQTKVVDLITWHDDSIHRDIDTMSDIA
jgi:molybdenum cofactor cytidylyltransferase